MMRHIYNVQSLIIIHSMSCISGWRVRRAPRGQYLTAGVEIPMFRPPPATRIAAPARILQQHIEHPQRMKVVVVESPAKAKTINKYLGPGYEVLASFGHVRDLPAKDGSVDPDADFKMLWEVDAKAGKRLSDIASAVKGADTLILATDPDREGEAISWHVLEVLRQKKALTTQKVERVVFNAITKQSVTDAMKHPRQIDPALVDAYLARRALDYLVGFTLSPVLWRKLPGARSAGRVQSVALRLVCDREMEIEKFVAQEYLVAGRDAGDAAQRHFRGAPRRRRRQEHPAARHRQRRRSRGLQEGARHRRVLASPRSRPSPASAIRRRRSRPRRLQQEASRKLGLAPAQTMRVAQRLYEGIDIGGETVGLITYMRTDGVQMAEEAITQARSVIGEDYGARYVPAAPRRYQTKAKNAQEAHEAIRPTDLSRAPQAGREVPRCRAGQALRTDLAARDGEPDGIGRTRAHHGRDRGEGRRAASSTCARPARSSSSTASSRSIRKAKTTRRTTMSRSACRR